MPKTAGAGKMQDIHAVYVLACWVTYEERNEGNMLIHFWLHRMACQD